MKEWGCVFQALTSLLPPSKGNAVDLRSSGRIRSAKILFLQLRKSIFRTPEKFACY
ncbi:Uncharacterized protein dnm_011790 [Desulfonema magnum]|uniref:Uncharacterized protein n=1 Tax=Desulfonema magnum TaxID=45655 RepID=A0A975BG90_9BACT|nr:Uncharacterized protein dnm_011790 [Desulfonema magnum]